MKILQSIRRELARISRRPIYLVMTAVVPILAAWFFLSLLDEGLPLRTPVAVVDLDGSSMARQVTRNLNSSDLVDIQYKLESYAEAMRHVRSGKIFGFFLIPEDFEKDAVAGRHPDVEFFSNMTYFVPGTLSFKGFKQVAVTTSGGIVTTKLQALGVTPDIAKPLVQPVAISVHGIHNPWTNYNYYLTPSFLFASISLLIMIMTAFSITLEIKEGTSPQWVASAGGNMVAALVGKLLPMTVVFTSISLAIEGVMFGFLGFPMHGSVLALVFATLLFVLAAQGFSCMVCCLLPNPRMALSVVSLLSILTFSFGGFSFPVENMYGAIAAFSYIAPSRYLFLIYVNCGLNGFAVHYVWWCYVCLLGLSVTGLLFVSKLRKACLHPVYVP